MAKTPEQKEQERLMREQQRNQLAADAAASATPIDVPALTPAQNIAEPAKTYEEISPSVREASMKQSQRDALKADSATTLNTGTDTPSAPTVAIKSREALPTQATEENYQQRLQNLSATDPGLAALMDSQRTQDKSFADYLQGIKDDYERERREGLERIQADQNAAKWTGLTELAASIANMVGVGSYNAANQQYKTYSQDWMQKADQDLREHRSRIDNLRQRQRDTELKMNQIRTQGSLAVAKAGLEAEQQKWLTAYRKAQVEYEQARTEAAKQKAQQDAKKAEAEYNAILALANQREASARGNLIRAGATAQNAASRQSSVENQNANRDARTGSQNMVDLSRAGLNWSRASGQPVTPPAGWSVQTPQAQTTSSNLPPAPSQTRGVTTDERGLPVRNRR